MKLILVAGATLLTAGAAFGFARAVDRLTSPPQIAAPSPAVGTERVAPGAAPARVAVPRVETVPVPAAAAPPETAAALREVAKRDPQTPVPAQSHDNVMHFTQPGPRSALDAEGPVRRYDFVNLPMIGVYR